MSVSSDSAEADAIAEFDHLQQWKTSLHDISHSKNGEIREDKDDRNLNASMHPQSSVPFERDKPLKNHDVLVRLGQEEILRLLRVYEDRVATIYPCVDLSSVCTYVAERFHSQEINACAKPNSTPTPLKDNWVYVRDIQVLNILLATALLIESHGQCEFAAQLVDVVEGQFASQFKIAEVDMKEILILTLLSIFHSYCDNEVISWRLIGMAARGSVELGLHCQQTWDKLGGAFPGGLEHIWAIRLFWYIYVLDRKWSIGTGLPFAIQDSDMDTNLPDSDYSTPYLTCMISYARLSTKIWGLVSDWLGQSKETIAARCAELDAQVQQWRRSIPHELRFESHKRPSFESGH